MLEGCCGYAEWRITVDFIVREYIGIDVNKVVLFVFCFWGLSIVGSFWRLVC